LLRLRPPIVKTNGLQMKSVVILQSNYIPWKGYFDLIHDADLFIFLDDVQYTKNDWRHRNKIKTSKGVEWLSVPAGERTDRLICEVELSDSSWQAKHWRTLVQNYSRSPYFEHYRPLFEPLYMQTAWDSLSQLNQKFVQLISGELGITTEFRDSRYYHAEGSKQEKLLNLLYKAGGTRYISGPAAKDYIDPEKFVSAGIDLVWKDYSGYPEYPQSFPPFEHGVTVLDLLFNVGPSAPDYIWGWRTAEKKLR